jgi:hypothetical protein
MSLRDGAIVGRREYMFSAGYPCGPKGYDHEETAEDQDDDDEDDWEGSKRREIRSNHRETAETEDGPSVG